jgi:hypothetical protein
MTVKSHIGNRLFVAQAVPATNNAAGFEGLTWVEVFGWMTLPQFGVSHSAIDVPDGASGFTRGLKGAGVGNDSSFAVTEIANDPGQIDIRELADVGGAGGVGSIRIVQPSGALVNSVPALVTGDPVEYAQGFFHSYLPNQGDTTSYRGFSVNFRMNAVAIAATLPA